MMETNSQSHQHLFYYSGIQLIKMKYKLKSRHVEILDYENSINAYQHVRKGHYRLIV